MTFGGSEHMRRFLIRLLEILAVGIGFIVWLKFTYRPYTDYLPSLHFVVYLPVVMAGISSAYLAISAKKDTFGKEVLALYDGLFAGGCVLMLFVEKMIYSFYFG
jgi:hypothetical protein